MILVKRSREKDVLQPYDTEVSVTTDTGYRTDAFSTDWQTGCIPLLHSKVIVLVVLVQLNYIFWKKKKKKDPRKSISEERRMEGLGGAISNPVANQERAM